MRAPKEKREGSLAGETYVDWIYDENGKAKKVTRFKWVVRRFLGKWMVTEEGTSHRDPTHDGKSFKLKRSAWAYINNTKVPQ